MGKKVLVLIFVFFLFVSLFLTGCGGDSGDTQAEIARLQEELDRAIRNRNNTNEQLRELRNTNRLLEERIKQLTENSNISAESVETATAEQAQMQEYLSFLEDEYDVLSAMVDNQNQTISEQQEIITQLVNLLESESSSPEELDAILNQESEDSSEIDFDYE